jgi:hypothetical protein
VLNRPYYRDGGVLDDDQALPGFPELASLLTPMLGLTDIGVQFAEVVLTRPIDDAAESAT